jgi:hypothetical protein
LISGDGSDTSFHDDSMCDDELYRPPPLRKHRNTLVDGRKLISNHEMPESQQASACPSGTKRKRPIEDDGAGNTDLTRREAAENFSNRNAAGSVTALQQPSPPGSLETDTGNGARAASDNDQPSWVLVRDCTHVPIKIEGPDNLHDPQALSEGCAREQGARSHANITQMLAQTEKNDNASSSLPNAPTQRDPVLGRRQRPQHSTRHSSWNPMTYMSRRALKMCHQRIRPTNMWPVLRCFWGRLAETNLLVLRLTTCPILRRQMDTGTR